MQQKPLKFHTLLRIKENASGKAFVTLSDAKEELKRLKGRCFLICVCGTAGIGKSTLLNLLIERFTCKYQEIFPIGRSMDATTKGVHMAVIPYEDDNFIFLDMEGSGDLEQRDEAQWTNNMLMLIASSCGFTFFNFSGNKPDTVVKHLMQFSKFSFYFLKRDAPSTSEEEKKKLCKYLQKHFEKTTLDKIFLIPLPSQNFQEKLKSGQLIRVNNGDLDDNTTGYLQRIDEMSKCIKNRLEKVPYLDSGEDVVDKLEELIVQVPYYKDSDASTENSRLKTIMVYVAKKCEILERLVEIEREDQNQQLTSVLVRLEKLKIPQDEKKVAQWKRSIQHAKSLSMIANQGLFLIAELKTFIEKLRSEPIDLTYLQDVICQTYISPLDSLIRKDLRGILEEVGAASKILGMSEEEIKEQFKDDLKKSKILSLLGLLPATVGLFAESLAVMSTGGVAALGFVAASLFYAKKCNDDQELEKGIPTKQFADLRSFVDSKSSILRHLYCSLEKNFHEILKLKQKGKEIKTSLITPFDATKEEFLAIQFEVSGEYEK